jgi:hypothetical protein
VTGLVPSDVVIAAAGIVAGLVVCLCGHRLFRVVLGLVGFATGAALTAGVASLVVGADRPVVLVAACVGGLISGFSLVWAYTVGTFLVGAAGGAVVGSAIGGCFGGAWIEAAIVVLLALAGGVLALKVERVVLAAATAVIGAAGVVAGGLFIVLGERVVADLAERAVSGDAPDVTGWVALGAWAVLAVIGCATQLGSGKKKKEKDE